jgi:hypothetical protein
MNTKRIQRCILLLLLFSFTFPLQKLKSKLIEELDSEYSISSIQSVFPPWWDLEWEETVTGFRIRGSSYDLHTLHTLQHWKGRFELTRSLFFTFDYFTDASADSQFEEREFGFIWRIKGKHHLTLFGYPYYDKKESDIGIRYSFEESPLDFFGFSFVFLNAPNNYTFKDRDRDSMRLYEKRPFLLSLDISLIKLQRNRMKLSYDIELPSKARYENRDGEVLFRTEAQSSRISITQKAFFADSGEWGWGILYSISDKDFRTPEGVLDTSVYHTRFRRYLYLVEKSRSPLHLFLHYYRECEETYLHTDESVERSALLVGIKTNYWRFSRVSFSYCRGSTHDLSAAKTRRNNRIILAAEHRFKNHARIGMNLGIEIDSRDIRDGLLGGYDKTFFYLQYPIR